MCSRCAWTGSAGPSVGIAADLCRLHQASPPETCASVKSRQAPSTPSLLTDSTTAVWCLSSHPLGAFLSFHCTPPPAPLNSLSINTLLFISIDFRVYEWCSIQSANAMAHLRDALDARSLLLRDLTEIQARMLRLSER